MFLILLFCTGATGGGVVGTIVAKESTECGADAAGPEKGDGTGGSRAHENISGSLLVHELPYPNMLKGCIEPVDHLTFV